MEIVTSRWNAMIVFGLFFTQTTWAADNDVLFQARAGAPIKDGQFGPVIKFQAGLIEAAVECGIDSKYIPNLGATVGPKTTKLIQLVSACAKYSSLSGSSARRTGAITEGLWKAILPTEPVPTVSQRAYVLAGSNEGTDYTHIEFNLGTIDPGILTWGPQGATSGQAFQVQRILNQIDLTHSDLITSFFGSEASRLRRFASTRSERAATNVIQDVMKDSSAKGIWKSAFVRLGENENIRSIYDSIMASHGSAGMPEAIADFYQSYWKQCWMPTQVDFAFFLDRAVQMDIRQEKTDLAVKNVLAAQQRLGRSFSAAERRRAIAANFQGGNSKVVGDRLARDVIFYIDYISEENLKNESLWELRSDRTKVPELLNDEVRRWKFRTGQKASDYGLSDSKAAPIPEQLVGRLPACLLTFAQTVPHRERA